MSEPAILPEDCPGHEWEYENDAIDHEFGTEKINYRTCVICGLEQDETEYWREVFDDKD